MPLRCPESSDVAEAGAETPIRPAALILRRPARAVSKDEGVSSALRTLLRGRLRRRLRVRAFGRAWLLSLNGGGRPRRSGVGILPFPGQHGDQLIDGHVGRALRHNDPGYRAVIDALHLHGGLVGLDLGDHVAGGDLVALLDVPLGQVALLHGRREGGHEDVDRQFGPLCLGAARRPFGLRLWRRQAPARSPAAQTRPSLIRGRHGRRLSVSGRMRRALSP